jgi:hypothetical protein
MNRVHKLDHRVILDTLSCIGGSRALAIAILFRYGEFDQIVSMGFDPYNYNDLTTARQSLAATELLRKHEELPTSFNRRSRAIEGFIAAEQACEATNERLRGRNDRAAQLFVVQRKIADVLGSFDPEEWIDLSGWGPGVTLTLRGSNSHSFNKFYHKGEATLPVSRFISSCWSRLFPLWELSDPKWFEGNRVITVPKNAKTDRVIAVEPSVNLYLQKGVGTMIRRRMRRFGVDLNSQEVNRGLSQTASKSNSLATVDFSAASDTLAYNLVLDLLPWKWFQVLDLLRSPRGVVNDDSITYEKFSSMGNGFTWELESLIFWALALACVPEDHPDHDKVSVFGDDVLIPADCFDEYRDLCAFCGFTINKDKSYCSSYYRESCGGHYWNGVDITPIYMRRFLKGKEIMKYHNRLWELSARFGGFVCKDAAFKPVCNFLKSLKTKYPKVPTDLGDSGFFAEFDEVRPSFSRRFQRGFNVKHFSFIPEKVTADHVGVLLTRLSNFGDREEGNTCSLPRKGRFVVNTSFVPFWSSSGPWVDIRVGQ